MAVSLHGDEHHQDGRKGAAVIMARAQAKHNDMKKERYNDLKRILEDRRREILNEVQEKIKDVRSEGTGATIMRADAGETSDADIQDDIEFALIQMKAETLHKIGEALNRLEDGTYGNCFECGEEISRQRLRALPFAVRCKDCEEAREAAAERDRWYAQRRGSSSLFLDMPS
jgi:DnaK suppressor protein